MKTYYVYEHWFKNECIYVGKGTYEVQRRKGETRAFQFESSRRTKEWNLIVKENFNEIEVKIIKEFDDEEEAYSYEFELTKKYQKNGYCKGNGNTRGRKKYNKDNSFYGKHHTEKTINQIKENQKKTFETQEYKEKSSLIQNKIQKRPDVIEKKRIAMIGMFKGEKHPMYGKRSANAKVIYLIDLDFNILKEFFPSINILEKSWRESFPKPNGTSYVKKCLSTGQLFHGLRLIKKEDYDRIKKD